MKRRSTLDKSSNNLFKNIEQLCTHDLLSYEQLSYDTILISIQSNIKLPLTINVIVHVDLSDRLMNKMILEFAASTQQLYPQILVYTFFRVLINARYSAKVNEWTL
ncbi:unnamed protein product [Rotaria sp. Silwood1]|nr:unnamed protein product [Rotaria sp. Silwood1]CAF4585498.1 unnamed protein product [Rotaria sp. Silwood1]CAF4970063.1 unnamed protein product [Rotaria sp. Silwood1]